MRTAEWRAFGGFDETLSLFYNDVDLCRRLWRQGRRIRYLAEAEVMHHRGASTKSFARMLVIWHKNRLTYYRKHFGAWSAGWLRLALVAAPPLALWPPPSNRAPPSSPGPVAGLNCPLSPGCARAPGRLPLRQRRAGSSSPMAR